MRSKESLLARVVANVVWGSGFGLLLGAILACLGAVIFVIRGPAVFERAGARPEVVILLYLIGGVVAGAIVGLLRPLTSQAWGAALAGIFAGLPVYTLFRFGMDDLGPWTVVDTISAGLFGLFLGGPVGFIYWKMSRSE